MSLFDFAAEEDKASFKVKIPDVSEYSKEDLLAFEKEVLGFYISGHPLEGVRGAVEEWNFPCDDGLPAGGRRGTSQST